MNGRCLLHIRILPRVYLAVQFVRGYHPLWLDDDCGTQREAPAGETAKKPSDAAEEEAAAAVEELIATLHLFLSENLRIKADVNDNGPKWFEKKDAASACAWIGPCVAESPVLLPSTKPGSRLLYVVYVRSHERITDNYQLMVCERRALERTRDEGSVVADQAERFEESISVSLLPFYLECIEQQSDPSSQDRDTTGMVVSHGLKSSQ